MSMKQQITGRKIVIEFARHFNLGGIPNRSDLEDVVKSFKRHVDLPSSFDAFPSVEDVVEKVCSFCGKLWTESDDSVHNWGCCTEDTKAIPPELLAEDSEPEPIEIVFNGPTGPESGRFVEVEQGGKSISFGEWIQRSDGFWVLRLPAHVRVS